MAKKRHRRKDDPFFYRPIADVKRFIEVFREVIQHADNVTDLSYD